jgi:hypothetical protein
LYTDSPRLFFPQGILVQFLQTKIQFSDTERWFPPFYLNNDGVKALKLPFFTANTLDQALLRRG